MRTWPRISVLATVSAALLIPSFAVPAAASASPSAAGAPSGAKKAAPVAHRAPVPAARPETGKRASAVAAALKLAKSSGKAVPVGSSSGSSSSVNPDGTFTVTVPASSKDGAYQVKIPSQLDGATVKSASVTGGAACSGPLSLSVTRPGGAPLGSGGTWKPSGSATCDSRGSSLPVTSAVKQAVADGWQTFSFKVTAPSGTTVSSPKLRVTYADPPSAPSALSVSSGSLKDAGCAGSAAPASSPAVVPGQAAVMRAGVYDSSGAPEAARFTYWVKGSAKKTTVTSAPALSGQNATAIIPASFTRGLGKNAVVDWTASAISPSSSAASSPSATCAMTADAEAEQAAPTISGGPATDPTPGTQETWTVTAAAASQSGVTPTAVVWGLDAAPPVSDPPSNQVTSIASGDTSAQVKVIVPSPGPHAFYAYVEYSDGSVSSTATSQFTAASDPAVSCPSFADALSNTGCTNPDGSAATSTAASTMFSNGSGNTSGTANADGSTDSFSSSELETAGWDPGGTVTIDGATFTLPQFGSSTSGPDNLLAAGQTIGMPAGSQGNSLVFLVAGTTTDTWAPSPSQDGQPMSPVLSSSAEVTGQDCDLYQVNIAGVNCQPAPEGIITYGALPDGSTAPDQDYGLEAPGWKKTTPSIAPVTLPGRATSSGISTSNTTGLYAVTVPLNPDFPVSSVTLPDVGAVVSAATGFDWPAVHIVGVQVANTTTATPGDAAGTVANAAGPWTGAWESPMETAKVPYTGSDYDNQTIRVVTTVSASGTALRLRLSDALAASGTAPLSIGAVTVAQQSSGAAITGTPAPVTFDGSKTVTIPEGGDVYSDPVLLPGGTGSQYLVPTAGEHLTVSIDLTGTYPSLPTKTLCAACTEYVSASGSGDETTDTSGSSFTGTGTFSGDFDTVLSGVDVLNTATTVPTVAVLGDGIIDGAGPGTPVHGAPQVSDDLASALALQPGGPAYGVVNAGIQSNQVLSDAYAATGDLGGPSALSRLARDVLDEPGIGTVIIPEGLEDLLQGTSEQNLYTNGLMELSRELTAWGITTIWTTQTPCYGYSSCTTSVDSARTTLNTDLLAQGMPPGESCSANGIPPCQYTAGFSSAVGDSDTPQQLVPNADVGDHVNLTPAGYLAETKTIPVIAGQPSPLSADQPPSY